MSILIVKDVKITDQMLFGRKHDILELFLKDEKTSFRLKDLSELLGVKSPNIYATLQKWVYYKFLKYNERSCRYTRGDKYNYYIKRKEEIKNMQIHNTTDITTEVNNNTEPVTTVQTTPIIPENNIIIDPSDFIVDLALKLVKRLKIQSIDEIKLLKEKNIILQKQIEDNTILLENIIKEKESLEREKKEIQNKDQENYNELQRQLKINDELNQRIIKLNDMNRTFIFNNSKNGNKQEYENTLFAKLEAVLNKEN